MPKAVIYKCDSDTGTLKHYIPGHFNVYITTPIAMTMLSFPTEHDLSRCRATDGCRSELIVIADEVSRTDVSQSLPTISGYCKLIDGLG